MVPDNKRISPRIDFNVVVHVEGKSKLQEFYSRNLSRGGIFLELPGEPPAIGTILVVTFKVPSFDRAFTVEAQVMHHHTYKTMDEKCHRHVSRHGIGLLFLNLSPDDQHLIDQFISGKDLYVGS